FTTSRLVWGDASPLLADDLVAPVSPNGAGHVTEGEAFLRDFLALGPRPVQDVEHEARQRGLSFGGTVRRASERIGVIKRWNEDGEVVHAAPKTRIVWVLP